VEKLIEHLPLLHPDAPFDPALTLADTQRWLRTLSYAETQALLAGWGDLSATEVESHLTALWQMTHPGEAPQAESQLFAHPFFLSPYILIGEGRKESMNDQEA
jgi:CHAT domain-containing protein